MKCLSLIQPWASLVAKRTVRAADLKPHPLNCRTHPEGQRAAVTALYDEVGEVRSLTAYVADADKHLGDAALLTLIDGHGRREWLPDEELEFEVLDLTDDEARNLLRSDIHEETDVKTRARRVTGLPRHPFGIIRLSGAP